jgi:flagellar biosynthesis protein FlhB
MSDKSQRTEQPTERRLEKARKEGQFPSAKEFISAMQFLVALLLLGSGGARWFADFRQTTRRLLRVSTSGELTAADVTHAWWQICLHHLLPLVAAGMVIAVATVGFRLATTRFGISFQKVAPSADRFNPLARLKDLPKQNLPALLQAVVMLPVFLWAVYGIARDKLEDFLALPLRGVEAGAGVVARSLEELFWKAAWVFLAFGAFDLVRQLHRYSQDLRMSKQDIRDEMKESEGDPMLKGRIRRLQRDQARRRMMKEVPTATAVVVNPTHFAIAIRYEMDTMAAPVVVAKGKNYLAARIRAIASEHQIPIVENPPLAQALYKSADVGQEIPAQLYRAVAEILAYIFKIKNSRGRP